MSDKKRKHVKKSCVKKWSLYFRRESEYVKLMNNELFVDQLEEKNHVSNNPIFEVIWHVKLQVKHLEIELRKRIGSICVSIKATSTFIISKKKKNDNDFQIVILPFVKTEPPLKETKETQTGEMPITDILDATKEPTTAKKSNNLVLKNINELLIRKKESTNRYTNSSR